MRGIKGEGEFPFTLYVNANYSFISSSLKHIPVNDEIHGPFPDAFKVSLVLDWTDDGAAKYFYRGKVISDDVSK